MEIEERTEGDITILELKGRMAGGEDDELLREEVESLVEEGRLTILLNMANVPNVDSACLGEILHCHIRVTKKGGTLKLVNVNEKLRSLLTQTRIAWVHDDLLSDPLP